MGHILFGLPEIPHFHLHSRVARKLISREHRVTALAGDAVTFEFYCHQGLACVDLRPETGRTHRRTPPPTGIPPGESAEDTPEDRTRRLLPIQEFAALDCRLRGIDPSGWAIRRAAHALERRVPGLVRLFESDRPDLVTIYDGRSGVHRMLHFLAHSYGVPVMHMGPGLIPMTLQVDPHGIDGDASFATASAQDYRRATIDDEFLAAATAAWLGRACPPPLARLGVVAPPLMRRVSSTAQAFLRREWSQVLQGMTAWQQAYRLQWPKAWERGEIPRAPFATLLLQDCRDPRIRLDGPAYTHPEQLIRSTWQALQRVEPEARLLVVQPGDTMPRPTLNSSWPPSVSFVPQSAAAIAVALAMAVVTVNHPLGLAAVLANTPVFHIGRSPYGIPGVTCRTDGASLAEQMTTALQDDQPTLRRRFLTKMLRDQHIWCPPTAPDSNGVAGIVRWIESSLDGRPKRPLRYRPGPVWPLAVADSRKSV